MKNMMQILNRRKIGFSITNPYIWLSLQRLQKKNPGMNRGIGCWHHGSRRGWWTAESNWCLMIRRSGFHNRNICYATSILQINYKKETPVIQLDQKLIELMVFVYKMSRGLWYGVTDVTVTCCQVTQNVTRLQLSSDEQLKTCHMSVKWPE